MSETQTEYETEQEINADFDETEDWDVAKIPGIVVQVDERDQVASVRGQNEAEMLARARLIAAAGTAAQEAREMGYDPVAAVEALPDLLEALQSLNTQADMLDVPRTVQKYLNRRTSDALASAEGSDNE